MSEQNFWNEISRLNDEMKKAKTESKMMKAISPNTYQITVKITSAIATYLIEAENENEAIKQMKKVNYQPDLSEIEFDYSSIDWELY